MIKVYFTCVVFLLIGCSSNNIKPVIIHDSEIMVIKSAINHIDYKLFIALPEDYSSDNPDTKNERYPVLYLLDPDDSFNMAHDIVRNLIGFGELEKIIIVGIGYKNQDKKLVDNKTFWSMFVQNRARDYIPFPIIKGINQLEESSGNDDDEYKNMAKIAGQGELFHNFLSHELIPFINDHYRTNSLDIL